MCALNRMWVCTNWKIIAWSLELKKYFNNGKIILLLLMQLHNDNSVVVVVVVVVVIIIIKMVFVHIRSGATVLKVWYGYTVTIGSSLADVYASFCFGQLSDNL